MAKLGIMHSPEIKAQALELLKDGYSIRKVAALLDVPRTTIGRWKQENDIPTRVELWNPDKILRNNT